MSMRLRYERLSLSASLLRTGIPWRRLYRSRICLLRSNLARASAHLGEQVICHEPGREHGTGFLQIAHLRS